MRASEETNVPGSHLRILLLAIGAVCCVRSQRGAVTLCVSASQVLIPWRGTTWMGYGCLAPFHRLSYEPLFIPHAFTISSWSLDLPLRRELFVFRCSSQHDIHPRTLRWLRTYGITHDIGTVLICHTIDVSIPPCVQEYKLWLYVKGDDK